LQPKLVKIILKNAVLTSEKTCHASIAKINCLVLLKDIIALYSEKHTKPINTLCGQNAELLTVKAGGKYMYHRVLKSELNPLTLIFSKPY
jgi:hypothetical protein